MKPLRSLKRTSIRSHGTMKGGLILVVPIVYVDLKEPYDAHEDGETVVFTKGTGGAFTFGGVGKLNGGCRYGQTSFVNSFLKEGDKVEFESIKDGFIVRRVNDSNQD